MLKACADHTSMAVNHARTVMSGCGMQHQVQPPVGWSTSTAPCIQRRPALCRRLARWQRVQAAAEGPDSSRPAPWYDNLNRRSIQGPPSSPEQQDEQTRQLMQEQEMGPSLMGEEGYQRWTEIKKGERQRVWESMRASAAERYTNGEMPDWFNPAWLAQEESPINKMIREMGDARYQYNDEWLGRSFEPNLPPSLELELDAGGDDGDDGADGGAGGRRGDPPGGGWWREDDPYWMLRDWGSHPMRWFTLGFAAIMALGGLASFTWNGSVESLFVGWGSAACLALCSLAMSDMRNGTIGELGVKAAWVLCALVAVKDGVWGWSHRPNSGSQSYDYSAPRAFLASGREKAPWDWMILRLPDFYPGACGVAAAAMCVLYMWTGMGGEVDGSLPMNPGAVYKSGDIVLKHRVWKRWGYGDETMRV